MKVDLEKLAEWLLKVFVAAFIFCVVWLMLMGCSAPKAVAEQQHHRSEADSLAVVAAVDSRLQEVREQFESDLRAIISSQQTEQQIQEQEKERVTETITTWVDSLGRVFKQEQRTTERDISRQQQQREQRMQQEYEQRLLTAVDSLDAAWQERFEEVKAHHEQEDSTAVTVTPVPGDNRPWYKKLWDAMRWMLVGAVVFALLWWTKKFWLPWLRMMF
jgi:hypothetical protein